MMLFLRVERAWLCRVVIAALVAHFAASASNAEDQASALWDLKRLEQVPAVEGADSYGADGVRSIFFTGEPYRGKPTKVYAYYGFPAGASPTSRVPGVVCVHGGSGTAFAEWVKIWNKQGFAAIAIDTNGAVPKSMNENPDDFRHEWAGPLRYGFENGKDDVRDQWPYHAVADVILANSLLRSFPEVDSDNLGITGISWGGYLTSLTAGIDPRFKFAIPVYGCGYLDDGSTWAPMIEKYGHDSWVKKWDPSSYLANAKMPTLWVNGTNDKHYHLGPYQRTYRLTKGPRFLSIRVRMDHGHGSGWSPPEIYEFAKSAVGKGSPLISVKAQGQSAGAAWVEYEAPDAVELKSAELVYTEDSGDWVPRNWKTVPAQLQLSNHKVVAKVPASTTVYFFNLVDSRNLLTSSEHVEVGKH